MCIHLISWSPGSPVLSGGGQDGLARQAAVQGHGGCGGEGATEPPGEQQQAAVPGPPHRGLPSRQPEERPHAQRPQLQGRRQGASLHTIKMNKIR